MSSTRIEKDFLGSKEIPADAYYGIHTARALDNFTVSGVQISHFPRFIIALAMVKKASMAGESRIRAAATRQGAGDRPGVR